MTVQMSKKPLVHAAVAGDRNAFDAVMAARRPRLLCIATAITGNPADAEEVVQEVLVKAWSALSTLRDADAIDAWLRTSTRRGSLNRIRSQSRRRAREHAEALHDPWRDVDAQTRQERQQTVQCLMEDISEDDRMVLLLSYWEGLSTRELAGALDVTESAARKRLQRARDRLKPRTLGVLAAALVSLRVEAAPRRPRLRGALLLGGVVAALTFFFFGTDPSPRLESNGTVASAPLAIEDPTPIAIGPGAKPKSELAYIWVDLSWDRYHPGISNPGRLGLRDDYHHELRRPDTDPSDPLAARFVTEEYSSKTSPDLIEEMIDAGFLDEEMWGDDPLLAQVALQLELKRAAIEARFQPGRDPAVVPVDHQPLWDLADAIEHRWPDSELAYLAGVYRLFDAEEDPEELFTLLQTPSRYTGAALRFLPDAHTLTGEQLALLEDLASTREDVVLPVYVTDELTTRAVDEAWPQHDAHRWFEIHRRALDSSCGTEPNRCKHHLRELAHRRSAHRFAIGDSPQNWKEAVRHRIRACDRKHPVDGVVRARAVWQHDAWTWTVPDASPFILCLTAPHEGPIPPPDIELMVEAFSEEQISELRRWEGRWYGASDEEKAAAGMIVDETSVRRVAPYGPPLVEDAKFRGPKGDEAWGQPK